MQQLLHMTHSLISAQSLSSLLLSGIDVNERRPKTMTIEERIQRAEVAFKTLKETNMQLDVPNFGTIKFEWNDGYDHSRYIYFDMRSDGMRLSIDQVKELHTKLSELLYGEAYVPPDPFALEDN
jgi:hypothetical protein